MRILFLHDEPWDSGITAYALGIAEILQNHGEEVVLGVRPGGKPENMAGSRGLKTIPVANFFDVRKALKAESWDIVNPHTGRTHTWSVLARKILGIDPKDLPIVRTRGDARSLKVNLLAHYLYRNTTAVIAASEHVRKQYELNFGLSEKQARTIYPSIQVSGRISPARTKTVGILGRLDPVKGHTVFLEAASHVLAVLKDVNFVIAGKEAGMTRELLDNHIRELGIQNAVHYLGYQDSWEEFMQGCRIGVVSSIGSEEVSRVSLEWMAVGRPLVGSLVGSLPELIEPLESGFLVPPGDSKALAEVLLKLLSDPKMSEKMGRKGKELIERRFSSRIQLEQTLTLFHSFYKRR